MVCELPASTSGPVLGEYEGSPAAAACIGGSAVLRAELPSARAARGSVSRDQPDNLRLSAKWSTFQPAQVDRAIPRPHMIDQRTVSGAPDRHGGGLSYQRSLRRTPRARSVRVRSCVEVQAELGQVIATSSRWMLRRVAAGPLSVGGLLAVGVSGDCVEASISDEPFDRRHGRSIPSVGPRLRRRTTCGLTAIRTLECRPGRIPAGPRSQPPRAYPGSQLPRARRETEKRRGLRSERRGERRRWATGEPTPETPTLPKDRNSSPNDPRSPWQVATAEPATAQPHRAMRWDRLRSPADPGEWGQE